MNRTRIRTARAIASVVATLFVASPVGVVHAHAASVEVLSRLVTAFDEAVQIAETAAERAIAEVEAQATPPPPNLTHGFDELEAEQGDRTTLDLDATSERVARRAIVAPLNLAHLFDDLEAVQAVAGDRATLELDAAIERVADRLSSDQRRAMMRLIDDHVATTQLDLERALDARKTAPSAKAGVLTQIEIAEHRATHERLLGVRALISGRSGYEP